MTFLMTTKLKPQKMATENSARSATRALRGMFIALILSPARGAVEPATRPAPRAPRATPARGETAVNAFYAVNPPSTTQVRPVTKLASSLARKATTAASSSGRPMRPSG